MTDVGIVNINAGVPGTASSTGANPVRPDPNFVTTSFYTNYGDIRYKALLVDLKKRFSREVPSQPDLSWGPDTQDRRHRGNPRACDDSRAREAEALVDPVGGDSTSSTSRSARRRTSAS